MLRLDSCITEAHCNISELTRVEHSIVLETKESEDAIGVEHLHQGLEEYQHIGKSQPVGACLSGALLIRGTLLAKRRRCFKGGACIMVCTTDLCVFLLGLQSNHF